MLHTSRKSDGEIDIPPDTMHYFFEGKITPYAPLPKGASQSFSWASKSFVTEEATIVVEKLSSCNAGYEKGRCSQITFDPSSTGCTAYSDTGEISCKQVQLGFGDGFVNPNYYVNLGAFSTYGTHTTILGGTKAL